MKTVILACFIACITFASCKKELVGNPEALTFNGHILSGYEDILGVEKFNETTMPGMDRNTQDQTQILCYNLLKNLPLNRTPVAKTVYFVSLNGYTSITEAEKALKLQHIRFATLSEVGELLNKYSPTMSDPFYCASMPIDLPSKQNDPTNAVPTVMYVYPSVVGPLVSWEPKSNYSVNKLQYAVCKE